MFAQNTNNKGSLVLNSAQSQTLHHNLANVYRRNNHNEGDTC